MSDEWVDEMISEATPLLAKWRGGRVKLWEYTPTHSKLTLRVESSAVVGNLHIVCGGCGYVRGPFSWDGCDFNIRRTVGGKGGITLSDEQGGFELLCGILSVEENVEPVYYPNMGAVTA